MIEIVKIDGSIFEGGGSIVRNAVALSALFQKPIEIFNIRANRENPGLRNQHAFAVKAIANLCDAQTEGVIVGSSKLKFYPGKIKGGEYEIDVKTAGSLTLLLQAILPVAACAPKATTLIMKGGTDVPMAPPIDYIKFVFLPMMEKLGLNVSLSVKRRGHYPKGGGLITCIIKPVTQMKPIQFKFNYPLKVEDINGFVHVIHLPLSIADRMVSSANEILQKQHYKITTIQKDCLDSSDKSSIGSGTGIILCAKTNYDTIIAGNGLGEKGLAAEKVGQLAATMLINQLQTGKPIDYHLADQLIIWMGISKFPSIIDTSQITLHALTNIEIIKKFSPAKFEIIGIEGKPGSIICTP